MGWGLGPIYQLDTVQTEGGAPLNRAWRLAEGVPASDLGRRWSDFMTPWQSPNSLADGILDDETYDWQADFDVMRASAGTTIVFPRTPSSALGRWPSRPREREPHGLGGGPSGAAAHGVRPLGEAGRAGRHRLLGGLPRLTATMHGATKRSAPSESRPRRDR